MLKILRITLWITNNILSFSLLFDDDNDGITQVIIDYVFL